MKRFKYSRKCNPLRRRVGSLFLVACLTATVPAYVEEACIDREEVHMERLIRALPEHYISIWANVPRGAEQATLRQSLMELFGTICPERKVKSGDWSIRTQWDAMVKSNKETLGLLRYEDLVDSRREIELRKQFGKFLDSYDPRYFCQCLAEEADAVAERAWKVLKEYEQEVFDEVAAREPLNLKLAFIQRGNDNARMLSTLKEICPPSRLAILLYGFPNRWADDVPD